MLETSHKVGKDILEYNTSYIRIMMNVRAVIASPFASMGKKKSNETHIHNPKYNTFSSSTETKMDSHNSNNNKI